MRQRRSFRRIKRPFSPENTAKHAAAPYIPPYKMTLSEHKYKKSGHCPDFFIRGRVVLMCTKEFINSYEHSMDPQPEMYLKLKRRF